MPVWTLRSYLRLYRSDGSVADVRGLADAIRAARDEESARACLFRPRVREDWNSSGKKVRLSVRPHQTGPGTGARPGGYALRLYAIPGGC